MNVQTAGIDSYVEAFELARANGPVSDLTTYAPPADHESHSEVLRELVRTDLEFGWAEGRPTSLAAYRRALPELFADAGAYREIAFEEYRLRRQAGEAVDPLDYEAQGIDVRDWPTLRSTEFASRKLSRPSYDRSESANLLPRSLNGAEPEPSPHVALFRAMYLKDPAAADRLSRAVQCWPDVGDSFCGFRLVSELGRGAFGRVYLARQTVLADRPVALKVVCDVRGEPQRMARLQHTNIVPVYSVHSAPPFQALCMPYFGGTTLLDVVRDVGGRPTLPTSGSTLVELVRSREKPAADPVVESNSPLEALANADYVAAVLTIADRLADGLAHAHERGVLHRDIKPANVLLAADGQPMLLDFNLAVESSALAAETAHAGGTLPYMPPELLSALRAESRVAADARGDIYALGLVMWELLAGRQPFPARSGAIPDVLPAMVSDRQTPPNVRTVNRAVSPAFAAVIAKCMAFDPARRYGTARQLHDDLRAQREDRPLIHTREASLSERVGKWRRRNPRLAVAMLASMFVLAAGALALERHRRVEIAETGLAFAEFRKDKQLAWMLLTAPDIPQDERARGFDVARRAIAQFDGRATTSRLSAADQDLVRRDLAELYFAAAGRSATAAGHASEDEIAHWTQRARQLPAESVLDRYPAIQTALGAGAYRRAITAIRTALAERPADPSLWFTLADCYRKLGDSAASLGCLDACNALYPGFYRTHYLRGIVLLERREAAAALVEFDAALRLQSEFLPALMQRAIARAAVGDLTGAVNDLHAAGNRPGAPAQVEFIRARLLADAGDAAGAARAKAAGFARSPVDADDWVVRGLARIDEKPAAALGDFDEALRLDPGHRAALRNKANVLAESLARPADALESLDRLIERSPDSAVDRAGRGVVLARLGRRTAALRDAEAALKADSRPFTRYQVAGIYALTAREQPGDAVEAIRLLASALADRTGLELVDRDSDLDVIRSQPEFQKVVAAARTLSRSSEPPKP